MFQVVWPPFFSSGKLVLFLPFASIPPLLRCLYACCTKLKDSLSLECFKPAQLHRFVYFSRYTCTFSPQEVCMGPFCHGSPCLSQPSVRYFPCLSPLGENRRVASSLIPLPFFPPPAYSRVRDLVYVQTSTLFSHLN